MQKWPLSDITSLHTYRMEKGKNKCFKPHEYF